MNWQTQGEDKLENLPVRDRLRNDGYGRNGRYRDCDFPWAHFWGFLEAHVGKHIDTVIHNFVNCDWCPARLRTASKIAENVEMNTFMKQGKVFFFCDDQMRLNGTSELCVEDEGGRRTPFFYIHPLNRVLKIARKKKYVAPKNEFAEDCRILAPYHQYCKEDGIWYEVKAKLSPTGCLYKDPDDNLLRDASRRYYSIYTGGRPQVTITLKRQLNSKTLKKNGLTNDVKKKDVICPSCGGTNCRNYLMQLEDEKLVAMGYPSHGYDHVKPVHKNR